MTNRDRLNNIALTLDFASRREKEDPAETHGRLPLNRDAAAAAAPWTTSNARALSVGRQIPERTDQGLNH